MKNIVLIGAGQLGSRHLQGIVKSKNDLTIWVVDPSKESLKIAEQRVNEVDLSKNFVINYKDDLTKIPKNIDIAIIATSSKPRLSILKDLIENHNVKNLILEKFLFPSLKDYEEARDLLNKNNIKAYVNCPRRLFPCYDEIKKEIDINQGIEMSYKGVNWGLCCNSIHLIDVFMYLIGEQDFEIETKELIPELIESKRNGYIELNGKLKIQTKNNNILYLECLKEDGKVKEEDNYVAIIKNGNKIFRLNEIKGILKTKEKELQFHMPFQSEMTGKIIDNIIAGESPGLVEYEVSSKYHINFLQSLLTFVQGFNKNYKESLPIT